MSEKGYVDSKIDEVKLQMTGALATAFSGLLSTLLILIVAAIAFVFLSCVLVRWLNDLLGEPWGLVSVSVIILVLLLVLILCRKKLFLNQMTRLFSGLLVGKEEIRDYDGLEKRLARARANTRAREEKFSGGCAVLKIAPAILHFGSLLLRRRKH